MYYVHIYFMYWTYRSCRSYCIIYWTIIFFLLFSIWGHKIVQAYSKSSFQRTVHTHYWCTCVCINISYIILTREQERYIEEGRKSQYLQPIKYWLIAGKVLEGQPGHPWFFGKKKYSHVIGQYWANPFDLFTTMCPDLVILIPFPKFKKIFYCK